MANPNSDAAAPKEWWRKRLIKIRSDLSDERRAEASERACTQLFQKCKEGQFVLSFASFGSEIDLWPLNHQLIIKKCLVLPVVAPGIDLQLFLVTSLNQLQPHQQWGMLEPCKHYCQPIDLSQIEIALIPGLGFDKHTKARLGYGKGHYDRLLMNKGSAKTWGIGFLEQAAQHLPHDEKDVPLDEVFLF